MLPHLVEVPSLPDELCRVVNAPRTAKEEATALRIVIERRDMIAAARQRYLDHPALIHAITVNEPPTFEIGQRVKLCRTVKQRQGASQFRGVARSKGKWRVRHAFGGRNRCIGTYKTELEAALAYDDAAFANRGFATKLNFPERYKRKECKRAYSYPKAR
jgi:hypothetical protein